MARIEALQAEIEKRKQAEVTLRETEQKLRNIIENSTNLFYMHGTDHVFTYMSPQSRHFFDCEPEEAMGCWTELITDNPVNRAAFEATKRAIETGERQPPYILESIGKKGRIIWVEVNESPIVEEGRTVAIVGSLTDITERKRAEEALRESEQRFASFMLHMPAAAWIKDMQGRYVYANAEAERVFSTPLVALLGKTDRDLFSPETARQFGENDCRVLGEGGSLQTTERLLQANGIEHHSIVSKFALADPDGKPAYVAGVALDITEQKRTEEALRESQRALSTLMSNLPGMAYRCRNDKDWTMEFVSEGCVELTGYQQAALVQNRKISYAQLIHQDDREYVWNDVQAALREERPFKLVYRISTVAGAEKWVWERGRGIFGPDSELVALEGFIIDITERKRMEAELEHFASFPHLNPTPIIEMDSDGRVTFCNRAAEKTLGKEECLDSSNPLIPMDLPEMLRALRQKKVSHFSRTAEVGELVFDEIIYLAPQFNSVRIYAIDVTERKRLEEERDRLAAIVENSDEAIIAKTLDGIIADWNKGAEKLYGYTANEIKGRHISILVPAGREDELSRIIEKIERGEKVEPFETIRLTKDGKAIPISLTISPIKDTLGKITGAASIAHDITEHKRAEQALRASEERLHLAIDATGLGTFDYYPQTGMMIWSEGIRRQFGLSPDAQVDYAKYLDRLHPDDRQRVDGIIQNLLHQDNGGEYSLEYRTIGFPDGKERWIAARGRVFYDETGRAVRFIGTTLDISERKRAEEKIEELNTNLAERAGELALANQELETFNYSVAHDLRRPLTAISGYCQIVKELCGDQLDAQCMEYLQQAYNGTLRMNRLIDALLKFSRLEHVELHREMVDLSAMAQLVAAEQKLTEPGRSAEFRIAAGMTAYGDANLLRAVLDNLLGNAWKYTGKRERAVIEFGMTEIEGGPVWFVRDNGEGFDMADAEKLFIPFQRLPGAEEFKGFGIGLATAERSIRRHGGKIWAEGEPDKGSTFYFTLQS